MLKKLFGIVLSICLIIPIISFSQSDPVVEKIIEIGTTDNRTMQHLDILCNRFGGRPIGSDAYENAANWSASSSMHGTPENMLKVEQNVPTELPAKLTLFKNYPNPFNASTTIKFAVHRKSEVSIKIYNSLFGVSLISQG